MPSKGTNDIRGSFPDRSEALLGVLDREQDMDCGAGGPAAFVRQRTRPGDPDERRSDAVPGHVRYEDEAPRSCEELPHAVQSRPPGAVRLHEALSRLRDGGHTERDGHSVRGPAPHREEVQRADHGPADCKAKGEHSRRGNPQPPGQY